MDEEVKEVKEEKAEQPKAEAKAAPKASTAHVNLIKAIEAKQMKDGAENFNVGDTVRVNYKVIEGTTERVQAFEGLVICKKNTGLRKTFTVRKISYGVGVERIFPMHSPRIESVAVVRHGRVRRAKLYYVRDKIGKEAKIKELIVRK